MKIKTKKTAKMICIVLTSIFLITGIDAAYAQSNGSATGSTALTSDLGSVKDADSSHPESTLHKKRKKNFKNKNSKNIPEDANVLENDVSDLKESKDSNAK